MPNPASDSDQLRFSQIRSRMLEGLAKNLPEYFLESSGAKDRDELVDKLRDSPLVVSIIDSCAYEAQCIEEERVRRRRRR